MKSSPRSEKVKAKIQEVLSEQLTKKIQDPRLHLVTITGVSLSRDLRIASIFFTCSGDQKAKEKALEGFESARGFLKARAAKELGLRYMPDLRFYHDESFDYGARMDRLFNQLKKEEAENTEDREDTDREDKD